MRHDHRQADLFVQPKPPAPEPAPTVPPYTMAEIDALYEQLRTFERVPDEWCPGWVEMQMRADATKFWATPEERQHLRTTFMAEVTRLIRVEIDEFRAKEEAEAAAAASAAAEAKAARRRRKTAA